jgi:hypothetical protein
MKKGLMPERAESANLKSGADIGIDDNSGGHGGNLL